MKQLFFFLVTLIIPWSLPLHAYDFIKKVDVPSGWDLEDWCSFNDFGYSLPVFIEKSSSNNLYVTIYNNDWSINKMFSIASLNEQDIVIPMADDIKGDGNDGYRRYMKVSQYFFNDDDKYEIVIGNEDDYYYRNVRVINEDGAILGTLPDVCECLWFFVIGCRHYIYYNIGNGNRIWYEFPGQTGAPLQKIKHDVNGDGHITSTDITVIYNDLLGN